MQKRICRCCAGAIEIESSSNPNICSGCGDPPKQPDLSKTQDRDNVPAAKGHELPRYDFTEPDQG